MLFLEIVVNPLVTLVDNMSATYLTHISSNGKINTEVFLQQIDRTNDWSRKSHEKNNMTEAEAKIAILVEIADHLLIDVMIIIIMQIKGKHFVDILPKIS